MTINCGGKLLDLSIPKVMAICNITNDSFYQGSQMQNEEKLISNVDNYIAEGADIIDIGGMSSRPGAKEIPLEEEIKRVLWGIEIIRKRYPQVIISVDTYRSAVVHKVAESGADMINDISGGNLDSEMIQSVGRHKLPYILMHMKGKPEDMQDAPQNEGSITLSLLNYFKTKIFECKNAGINDVIIDPGFGFGKTLDANYHLLKSLGSFKLFELPILVGLSRKSMIYKTLGTDADSALNGTTAAHMLSLLNGANILRVHDVKAAKECIAIYQQYNYQ